MMSRRAWLIAVAALAAGCAVPQPFTDEFYAPMRVRAGATGAVVVRAFTDQRPGGAPSVVFEYDTPSGERRIGRATAPVGEGVAQAFVRGLSARGFQVTDETKRAAGAAPGAAARAIVTGRVAEFGVTMARSSLVTGSRQRVGCRVTVEVRDATGARRLWERDYQRVVEGAMDIHEPFHLLARALADVVEQAVADPELLRAVRGAGG
ncbi:MAG: hypothetical protein HYU41_00610 [Candidatus Rokubacteria bacterium]|nr:hypothetical protein [Candidatus Rokubacteria bacterium]